MNKIMRLVFIGTFTLALINSSAQDKFTTYDRTYGDPETYDIEISTKEKNGDFKLYINAWSLDATHKKGGIGITKKQYPDFINAINEAKVKYEEWVKTAKDNNVKELSKQMDIKCKVSGNFIYGKDWHFQFTVNPTFNFKIIEDESDLKYLLIFRTGELTSSSNQYMKVDGFALVFTSTAEIDAFTKAISIEAIDEFIKKPKEKDLFKN